MAVSEKDRSVYGGRLEGKGEYARVALAVQRWPVRNAGEQHPDMDVIEMILRIDPCAAAIVDLEAEIGRCDWRLDGRQIGCWSRWVSTCTCQ